LNGPIAGPESGCARRHSARLGDRRGTWIYYRAVPQALQAAAEALTPGRVSA
jgi:hypothetical protein